MRVLTIAACLLIAFAAAPGAEASCHFCLDDTREACASGDTEPAACLDNATYLATHYPQHVLEAGCEVADC